MTTEPIEITDFTIHARGTPGHTACGMELQRAVLLCWRAKEVTCEACLKKLGEVETDIVKKHVSIQRNIRLRDMLADFLPSIATDKINNDTVSFMHRSSELKVKRISYNEHAANWIVEFED
jgi:hypothetical protein